MTAIDALKTALHQSQGFFMALVNDMKSDPLRQPTAKGGNHTLWVVGHLTHSEAGIVSGFLLGEPNPLAKWDYLFGQKSQPVADASKYPSMDELLAAYDKVRAATLKQLDRYTDADLEKPSKAPEQLKAFFGTIGTAFSGIAVHQTFHAGQVSCCRKAAGRDPILG